MGEPFGGFDYVWLIYADIREFLAKFRSTSVSYPGVPTAGLAASGQEGTFYILSKVSRIDSELEFMTSFPIFLVNALQDSP